MNYFDTTLYLVTDSKLTLGRTVEEIVDRASKAGVTLVQYRDKINSDEDYIKQAKKLKVITAKRNVRLILNDRVHLVKPTGADGVHIGQNDLSVKEAKKIIGDDKILGVSFLTPEQAVQAENEGADYIALSPVFSTKTKADIDTPAGIEGIKKVAPLVSVPIVGIGGINSENAKDVISAGASGVAVVTAITMAEDIETAVKTLLKTIAEH